MSKHSLTKKVGIGSSEQDFVGLCIIILCTSPSETVAKVLKLGAIESGANSRNVINKIVRTICLLNFGLRNYPEDWSQFFNAKLI